MKNLSFPLLLAVLLALSLSSCSSNSTIVHDIQEREANEIIVLLASYDISASKVQVATGGGGGGSSEQLWNVDVPPNKAIEAMSILNDNGFPRIQSESLLEIFGQSGLIPSSMQEKIRYQAGLAQQIANTIRSFDGVLDASVILAIPAGNPLNPEEKLPPPTAAVFVKNNGVLDEPNSHLSSKIKRLVAASVPELTYNNVTVVGDRAVIPALPITPVNPLQKPLESVWSVQVTESSAALFKTIVYVLLGIVILLLAFVLFLIWRFRAELQSLGLKEFFSLRSYPEPEAALAASSKKEEKPKEKETSSDKREREDI